MIDLIPLGLWDGALFNNVEAFLLLMIFVAGIIGGLSGYASVGVYGVFAVFVRIAVNTDLWIFKSLLYVCATVLMLFMAMQVWHYINSTPSGGASA